MRESTPYDCSVCRKACGEEESTALELPAVLVSLADWDMLVSPWPKRLGDGLFDDGIGIGGVAAGFSVLQCGDDRLLDLLEQRAALMLAGDFEASFPSA